MEEVKHSECEKRERENNQNNNKRDAGSSSFSQRPVKWARYERPSQVKPTTRVEPVLKVE